MGVRDDLKFRNSSNCKDFQEITANCTSSQLELVVPGAGFELATSGRARSYSRLSL